MSAAPQRSEFPVLIEWPVQWGDQDLYGHVNNTLSIRWFESGRIAYLERIGFDRWLAAHRIGPILAAVHCNYRRQIRYPDTIEIGTRVTKIGRTSVTIAHAIWSKTQDALVSDGDSTVVCFHYDDQKPTPIPDELRQAIAELEGRTF
ncbi:MAG: thioesterase family protein [Pirellulales bacterium]